MKFLYNTQVLLLDRIDTIEFIKLGNAHIYDAIDWYTGNSIFLCMWVISEVWVVRKWVGTTQYGRLH